MALTEKEEQTFKLLQEYLENPSEGDNANNLIKLIGVITTPDSGVAVANIRAELTEDQDALFEKIFKKIMEKRYGKSFK